jgi:hypothetical protein
MYDTVEATYLLKKTYLVTEIVLRALADNRAKLGDGLGLVLETVHVTAWAAEVALVQASLATGERTFLGNEVGGDCLVSGVGVGCILWCHSCGAAGRILWCKELIINHVLILVLAHLNAARVVINVVGSHLFILVP